MRSILYITYIDFGDYQSGSSVRPQMMYDAFLELGYHVELLEAQQNRRSERKQAVNKISEWLEDNKPEFCYVESPSGPIFNSCDHKLLKKIHKMGIPLGYFYRDAAFKFDSIFTETGKKTFKQKVIAWMSEKDIRLLKKVANLVYLPTRSMAQYFSFPKIAELPPACSGNFSNKFSKTFSKQCIYVGGVSKRYGTDTLLKAFDILNAEKPEYTLTLVCRKEAVAYISEEHKQQTWLKLVHTSGKENLKVLYEAADIALYPIQKNEYNDFAFSVKLLEYMEFGLPVVSTNCTEAADFISKFSTGLVSQDSPEDFAHKIQILSNDQTLYNDCAKSVVKSVYNGNLWLDRARTVAEDLSNGRNHI